jgi:hypothetical protein
MKHIRFSLRSLLLAFVIFAILIAYFVRPYLKERRSRLVTHAIEQTGIGFDTESANFKLRAAGLGPLTTSEQSTDTPVWTQTLMRGLPAPASEIRELWLWDDEQVHAANDFFPSLPKLQTVYVWGRYKHGPKKGQPGVTANGLEELARNLPHIDRLILTDVPVADDFPRIVSPVRVLAVRAQASDSPLLHLSNAQLDDILSIRGIEVLMTTFPLTLKPQALTHHILR